MRLVSTGNLIRIFGDIFNRAALQVGYQVEPLDIEMR